MNKEIQMKKFIAATSAFMVIGFAVALANADDMSNTTTKDSKTTTEQQPGTMGSGSSDTTGNTGSINSGDTSTESSKSTTTTSKSSAGTMGSGSSDTANSNMGSSDTGSSTSAMNTSSDKWKHAKTCTDSNGTTFYKGKKGFDRCVSQMKKAEKNRDQMGGTAGGDMATGSPGMSSGSTSGSDTSQPSSGSNMGGSDTSSSNSSDTSVSH
jgi:hypothetical protein